MNNIHNTCIIYENVEMGSNNTILPYTIIYGPTKIGNNNIIGPHTIIGTPGQDTRERYYDSSECEIEIGNNNIIREFTAIQKPRYKDITKIGNNVFLMQSVHIPHDAILHDKVVVTSMSVLGGITRLLEGANIGLGVSIHQYSIIGHFTLLAMGATVKKNVKPFSIYVPDKRPRVNYFALKKFGLDNYIDEISKYVNENIEPTSDQLLKYTEEFSKYHYESKREMY